MLCWHNSLFVGALIFSSLLAQWRWQNSFACLWPCTDAPWGAWGRSGCSSSVQLAAPLFDGGSHCWGSWIAVSNGPWIHVSTWMEASLQCKTNESVGHPRWTIWWLPLVVPGSLFETCFCKVGIIGALRFDDIAPFGKTNVLETLTYKVKQCRTIFCEREEALRLTLCLIGHNMSGNI